MSEEIEVKFVLKSLSACKRDVLWAVLHGIEPAIDDVTIIAVNAIETAERKADELRNRAIAAEREADTLRRLHCIS